VAKPLSRQPLPKIHHKVPLYLIADVCYIAGTKLLSDAPTIGRGNWASVRFTVGNVMGQNRNGSRNGTPAYKKIQNVIRKRIAGGQLKIGDAVDSERELARIHSVSLMTARHALAGLEREGIVERRRGSGTFVARPKIHFNKLMSYTEHMSSRGLAPRSRVLSARLVEHQAEIAARLGLPATCSLVKIDRLRLTGEEPFALETCYLPAPEFGELIAAPLGKSSLFAALQHDYGVELAYADEEVDATPADVHNADLLSVPRGAPLLRIRQVIYSTSGKPVIYGVGFYRSERHTLFIRRFR
jgi:GntR family transcriptional regulator